MCGSGPLLGAYAPLSQDGFQNQGSWEVGCLVSPIGPSHVLLVCLQGSTVFLIRDSCYETTQWRGYCCAWPRWTVSVSSSPTLAYILSIHQVDNFTVYTYIEYSYIQILLETEIFWYTIISYFSCCFKTVISKETTEVIISIISYQRFSKISVNLEKFTSVLALLNKSARKCGPFLG